ncbi:unnamed protein product [Didymodactylos carnosus]|uniref:G-protein coupled receptors family 2 profile 2 domain-containing protein n=1 Tax=Didymodactylos carnosus TaxID=1234261 RepID=A0A813RS58_9BILA|nr:unnamed protein product [Didymodactylos carnosus]CAF0785137.1 unnamed protein product [Didymodactylos carnosus]CAF3531149.1 unnamed protein product [Didymodactylos carnosus]CAF3568803.1 unnamed protein product [Didymodactylos carnosus]
MSTIIFVLILTSTFRLINSQLCSRRDECTQDDISRSTSIFNDAQYFQSRNCFCDNLCLTYDDCCENIKTSNSSIKVSNYECIDFLSHNSDVDPNSLTISVWMTVRCLPNYFGTKADNQCQSYRTKTLSDDPTLFIPVTSTQTNVTYRNYFCAYCNNDIQSLVSWSYKSLCDANLMNVNEFMVNTTEIFFSFLNLTKNCMKMIYYPMFDDGSLIPSVLIRPCKQFIQNTCPNNSSLAFKCNSINAYRYLNITQSNQIITYRNEYCLLCQQNRTFINNNTDTCNGPYYQLAAMPSHLVRYQPLSILFDSDLLSKRMQYSTEYSCTNKNKVYDIFGHDYSTMSNIHQDIINAMKCQIPVRILKNSVKILNNGSILFENFSIQINREDYLYESSDILIVCSEKYSTIVFNQCQDKMIPLFPFYRTTLSLVCTIISLTSLILCVIIYSLVPLLRNIPGKCLLLLVISLFIAQLFFITTADLIKYSQFCIFSGIIIHYFYIAMFAWLTAISFDLWITFGKMTVKDSNQVSKRFLYYNMFVWLFSFVIVFISIILHFTNYSNSFSPEYGKIFCSISQPNAMITFFLIPIGCLLVVIFCLFIITIYNIRKTNKITKFARNNSNSEIHLIVYVRLASLMGLNWLLLILSITLRYEWMWIIFECVNSMPGVYLCIGFLCNKRLLKSLRQILHGYKLKAQSSILGRTTSSSSTTTTTTTTTTANLKQNYHQQTM